MRPDAVNWANKQNRVALSLLPRPRAHRKFGGWAGLAIIIQATCAGAMLVALQGPWREASRVDHLALVLGLSDQTSARTVIDGGIAVMAGLVGGAILVIPLAYRASRDWSAGLRQLHTGIRRLTQGADPQPLAVGGNDEVAYLLAAFNEMAGQLLASRRVLLESNQDLERRVADRTEQLQHATHAAEQANRAKSAFLASMSHEIRTPLHGIIGSLSLLRDGTLDQRRAKLVRTAWLSGGVLLNLINDILDLSAIEAGQLVLADRPFCLEELIEEAIAIVSPLANQKQVDVTYVIAHTTSARFTGDPSRLRQVLINLLNNAIKFTDTGSVEVLAGPGKSGDLRLEVRDTGVGIPPDAIDRLFVAFNQAGNDPATTRGGTGLGLSICRQLITLMGGRIGVESTLGKGSCFWLEAPLRPDDAADAYAPQRSNSPKRVVIVAASAAVDRMIRHCLEPYAHQVSAVTDPHATLDTVRASAEGRLDTIIVGQAAWRNAGVEVWLPVDGTIPRDGPMVALLASPEDETRLRETHLQMRAVSVLCLPLARQAIVDIVEKPVLTEERPAPRPHDNPETPPQKLSGLSVLVTEDNPINQFVTAQVLQSLGIFPDIVESGEAALAAVQSKRYDLLLMDCLMPGMDGFSAARRIREWEANGTLSGRLPIIALTANVMRADHQACVEAGLDDCLAKPIDIADLQSVLRRHLNFECVRLC